MADLTVRAPSEADVAELAARLRAGDIAELAACNHTDLAAIVRRSVDSSRLCWAVADGDTLLCIFGAAPLRAHLLLEHVGIPWMLGTDAVLAPAYRRALIQAPPSYIARMLEVFPRLLNFVHADNRHSVRWLRHMGFTLAPAGPFGPNAAPFHRFEMQRHV